LFQKLSFVDGIKKVKISLNVDLPLLRECFPPPFSLKHVCPCHKVTKPWASAAGERGGPRPPGFSHPLPLENFYADALEQKNLFSIFSSTVCGQFSKIFVHSRSYFAHVKSYLTQIPYMRSSCTHTANTKMKRL